jgi:hypothetical protein
MSKENKVEKVSITLETLVNAYLATSDLIGESEKIASAKREIAKKYTKVKRTISENTVLTMVYFFDGLVINKVATAEKLVATIKECGGEISNPTVSRYKAIGGAVVKVSDGKITNEIKKLAEKTLNLMITESKTYGVKTIESIESIDQWQNLVSQAVGSNADEKALAKVCKAVREGKLDGAEVIAMVEQAIADAAQLDETLEELAS